MPGTVTYMYTQNIWLVFDNIQVVFDNMQGNIIQVVTTQKQNIRIVLDNIRVVFDNMNIVTIQKGVCAGCLGMRFFCIPAVLRSTVA